MLGAHGAGCTVPWPPSITLPGVAASSWGSWKLAVAVLRARAGLWSWLGLGSSHSFPVYYWWLW